MPVITVEASKFTIEKKRELAKVLTQHTARILGLPEAGFTVFIKDNPRDCIAVGGQLLSDKDQALAEKK